MCGAGRPQLKRNPLGSLTQEASLGSDMTHNHLTQRGRHLVIGLAAVILGLHPVGMLLYVLRFGPKAITFGRGWGPSNFLLGIVSFVAFGLPFLALYKRQRWARWLLAAFLAYAALAAGIPDLLAVVRKGNLTNALVGGGAVAVYLLTAAILIFSRDIRAYVNQRSPDLSRSLE